MANKHPNPTARRNSPPGGSWSPSRLPKLRDQTAAFLRDPASPVRAALRDDPAASAALGRIGDQLPVSELYWVTPVMAALAVSSAATLPEVRWTVADRPSVFGLVLWDGGIGQLDYGGAKIPATAMSWSPDPDGLAVMLYMSRPDLLTAAEAAGAAISTVLPPLVPLDGQVLSTAADWTLPADLEKWRTPLTVLYATWALMQQPTLADRVPVAVDPKLGKAYQRAGRPDPEVTLVDLRRRYVPSTPADPDGPGRTYRWRWVVSGHWRDQPCGPARADRRKTWIASYTKGPDGAPLLETTRVNVWRR